MRVTAISRRKKPYPRPARHSSSRRLVRSARKLRLSAARTEKRHEHNDVGRFDRGTVRNVRWGWGLLLEQKPPIRNRGEFGPVVASRPAGGGREDPRTVGKDRVSAPGGRRPVDAIDEIFGPDGPKAWRAVGSCAPKAELGLSPRNTAESEESCSRLETRSSAARRGGGCEADPEAARVGHEPEPRMRRRPRRVGR